MLMACTGTGGNPSLGEQAAEESASTIGTAVGNADMVQLFGDSTSHSMEALFSVNMSSRTSMAQQLRPATLGAGTSYANFPPIHTWRRDCKVVVLSQPCTESWDL